jgi:hypothetical protein
MDPIHIWQRGMEGIRNSVQKTKACFNLWHTGGKMGGTMAGRNIDACVMHHNKTGYTYWHARPSTHVWTGKSHGQRSGRQWHTGSFQMIFGQPWKKGVHGYTRAPNGGDIATPFPPTYNDRRNHLKLAFREQDTIVWDNLIKGQLGRQWIEYVSQHIHNENIKLKASEWAPKMIRALWDQMLRMWQYPNDAIHENDTKKVTQFKAEAVDRDIERLDARLLDLMHTMRTFKEQHIQRVEHVKTLQHNSRKWWASLAKLYLEEVENRIETDTQLMDQYLQGRSGVR